MEIFSLGDTSTPNLRKVQVNEEEGCWEGDMNGTIQKMFSDKVGFRSFKQLNITKFPELKDLWYGPSVDNMFQSLKSLVVHKCDFLSDVLFPSTLLHFLQNLEDLEVKDCDSLEAVFDVKSMDDKEGLMKQTAQMKKLTVSGLPKLKHIWNKDPQEIISFHNLQAVHVESCHSLEYLFPLSIATKLPKIEVLEVLFCSFMETIVAKKEEMEGTARFVLNQLTSLDLRNMLHLRGFYAGNFTLSCPSLKQINVFLCENLMLFMTQSINYQEVHDVGKLGISLRQPLFTVQEVIPNLEKLTLDGKCASMILQDEFPSLLVGKLKILRVSEFKDGHGDFPDWFVRNVPNLEDLVVEHSAFKEIFQDKMYAAEEGQIQSSTRVKHLALYTLPKLQHICNEGLQIDPVLEVLETLDVRSCSSLINLVPSSVTFSYLTFLEVSDCNGLIKFISSSTAKSLVKLEKIKIENCNLLEEIVTEQEDEAKDGIAFISLKILELICLPQLNKFCSSKCFIKFPLLWRVVVRQCPRMEIFSLGDTSTPNLRKVQVNEEEWCWEGNMNGTIQKMFSDKVGFCSLKHLNLTQFPGLKDLWFGPSLDNMFQSLKSLVVHKCDFLSDVLFTSTSLQLLQNLEDLEVKDCDSLEAVFDVKSMDDKDGLARQTAQMRTLTLSGLPKLKHIWNKDPQEIISFHNLQAVHVESCNNLEYLFPLSIATKLPKIEVLEVLYCPFMKTIAAKKEEMEGTARFVLNQLTSLVLWGMLHLRGFYSGNYTLSCPSLKQIDVFRCENLLLFMTQSIDYQEAHDVGKLGISLRQPLFIVQEVIPNLEELTLDSKCASMILQDEFPSLLVGKLKILRVSEFEDEHGDFPDCFVRNVPNLEDLVVEHSAFKEIFQDKMYAAEEGQIQSNTRVKHLELDTLPKLQHICNEGFQIDPVLEVLETLNVWSCSSLINLVPSSVTFSYLTFLEVSDCNGLIKLISSSTARSLVKLEKMKIEECNLLEEIVTELEDEAKDGIAFISLKILELICLPQLNKFCSSKCFIKFPLLWRVVVRQCPRMEIFSLGDTSTPNLRTVQVNEEGCWEGNMNGTIQKMFSDKDIP